MLSRCGHQTERSFAKSHNGLCRKCHSNFSFLLDLEEKFGEDVVVEYWYGLILTRLSDDKQATECFIDHLTEFYSNKLSAVSSSKRSYIQKMLYMLNSLKEPFDIKTFVQHVYSNVKCDVMLGYSGSSQLILEDNQTVLTEKELMWFDVCMSTIWTVFCDILWGGILTN